MKRTIRTTSAPVAIGPYSQAVLLGELVFTSGQLPMIPETMEFADGGIQAQSLQSLENLLAVLEACGASAGSVVKTTCFLSDMSNFAEFNQVYESFFGTENAPARSCVEVARLPKDALVEVEAIAYIVNPSCTYIDKQN